MHTCEICEGNVDSHEIHFGICNDCIEKEKQAEKIKGMESAADTPASTAGIEFLHK